MVTGPENPAVNEDSLGGITKYAWLLIKTGRVGQAQHLLEQSLRFVEGFCDENLSKNQWSPEWSVCNWDRWNVHALLQHREETLEVLQRLIVEEKILLRFDRLSLTALDFLQDDPEFQQLMKIIIDAQRSDLERVREMQRNGELESISVER